jgi:glycosyltransferase involved in cell wall biosynthesis
LSDDVWPTLSVVIPVRNGERHLAATIESVLAERLDSVEILVVDDGSTDRSAEIAESFGGPVRCLRGEAKGVAAARNAGWTAARARFVFHLDADDLVVPGSLALRMAVLEASPDVDMVTGYVESFFSAELDADARAGLALPEGSRRGHLAGASIVRTGLFERIGPLNEKWRVSADMDWYARATEAGIGIAVISDVVLRRRIHGKNLSLTSGDEQIDRVRIVKAALDRRRAAALKPPT